MKSYAFQESESYGRMAIAAWAAEQGHAALNLQHDGVVVSITRGVTRADAEAAVTQACSMACGYAQDVEAKAMLPPGQEPQGREETLVDAV